MSIVDWSCYRACPVCFAGLGCPCLSMSGVVNGVALAVEAPAAHGGRELRTGYGRG